MMTRERYLDLSVCDEAFGSWGSQGIEVACKSWLSGGRVMVNQTTWYAHCFRTQGGDFSFPYPFNHAQAEHAKQYARELFFEGKWDRQVRPLSWLVEKFWPVRGWTQADLDKIKDVSGGITAKVGTYSQAGEESAAMPIVAVGGHARLRSGNDPAFGVVYYTDNRLDPAILTACQRQLKRCVNRSPIVAVSLQPVDFECNIVLPFDRGYLSLFKQILAGLEALDTEFVFMAEHDVLYDPSHFSFAPPRQDVYYYNLNCWKVRASDGHALHYIAKQTSQLCANRELLVAHYHERVRRTEEIYWQEREIRLVVQHMGFEPGSTTGPSGG
jgi:hypothetical protein